MSFLFLHQHVINFIISSLLKNWIHSFHRFILSKAPYKTNEKEKITTRFWNLFTAGILCEIVRHFDGRPSNFFNFFKTFLINVSNSFHGYNFFFHNISPKTRSTSQGYSTLTQQKQVITKYLWHLRGFRQCHGL